MFRRFVIAAVLVAGASAPALAFAGWHGHWIGPVGGFLSLLLVVALVVLVVGFLGTTRRAAREVPPAAPPAPRTSGMAFSILAERFARGEIDASEYETRRRVLAGEGPSEIVSPPASTPPPAPAV